MVDARAWVLGPASSRSDGWVVKYKKGLMTHVEIWGHYTCNTIMGSFDGHSGTMKASVYLCPGLYNISWSYWVEGSARIPLFHSDPEGLGQFNLRDGQGGR